MKCFSLLWAAGWLLYTMAVAQRFAAMDSTPTLSPRYYRTASPLRPLGKRDLAPCVAGEHTCSDIGPLGVTSCCPDDTYCAVDAAGSKAVCCAIGSVCNSPCSEPEYQCVVTVIVTTVSPTTTATSAACCPRQCTQTSMFGCPSSLGGGCCFYGQTCASGSQCLWTSKTTSAVTSLVSQIPAGCTTGQIACPSSLGGGCCAASQNCTFVGSGPHCAAPTVSPTASGVAAVPQNNEGLSAGAKAGIGVGAVVGIALVVGMVTWFVLLRRRQRSSRGTVPDPGSDARTLSARTANSPRQRRPGLGPVPREGRPEMASSNTDNISPDGRLRGLTADYFGPAAVPGPFTDSAADSGMPASAATTPPGGNNRDRAVPREPHSPDDITAPVEIDSRAKQRDVSDTIAGRFELYGTEFASPISDGTASPYDAVSPYTPSPGTMPNGPDAPVSTNSKH